MKQLFLTLLLTLVTARAEYVLPTFPGAMGFGMATKGGRGGQVYIVTSGADDTSWSAYSAPAGTLRWAFGDPSDESPRMIILKVNGEIRLKKSLAFGSNLSVFGNKAPGQGCYIAGAFPIRFKDSSPYSHEVVFYGVRILQGYGDGWDYGECSCLTVGSTYQQRFATNAMVAKSTFRWGIDQTLDMTAVNGTIQDCIIAEPLAGDNELSPNWTMHNFGGFYTGGAGPGGVSVLRNFFAHCSGRTPKADGIGAGPGVVDWRNNVMFNGGVETQFSGYDKTGPVRYNVAENYYWRDYAHEVWLPTALHRARVVEYAEAYGGNTNGLYFTNNWKLNNNGVPDTAFNVSNYLGVSLSPSTLPVGALTNSPHDAWWNGLMTAQEALAYVTNNAGAFPRDSHDLRNIGEMIGNEPLDPDTWYATGWAEDESDVGGWPTYTPGTPYTDADSDGMPDSWEVTNFGNLNRTGKEDADGDGYTDLEEFLYDLDPNVEIDYYRDNITGILRSGDTNEPPPVPQPPPPVEGAVFSATGATLVISNSTFKTQ